MEKALADENDTVPTCDEGETAENVKITVSNRLLQSGDVYEGMT